ncbi:hypothetical protein ZIOFF_015851 [Zingiber officinale]|uniref:NmrA-like domain-containing protein n=1 Tax=Zingiber officinale TaxID=94328 RepID=A0A8J5HFI6_ZINOF|nr:hypothetical protein ZIOFF_015851 [Zingiber officinale]
MASTSLSSLPSPPSHHLRRRLPSNLPSLSWRHTLAPTQLGLPSASPPPGRCCVPLPVRCISQAAVVTSLTPGTPVRPTSILVVGATGTLGRQVVRRALDEGYDVRCLVRPRPAPADFLRDWGAIVVNGDLSKPETIPATLVGIHTIIDCATGRPEEPIRTALIEDYSTSGGGGRRRSSQWTPDACDKGSVVEKKEIQCTELVIDTLMLATKTPCNKGLAMKEEDSQCTKVDWEGKVALIQCAKAMGIEKYVFYSIHNCDKHPEVPLMEIKHCTEKFLHDSGLNYLIIRLCGFMQGLIGQYAVPILEEKSVWGTDAPTRIAYMDTQDIARLTFIAARNEKINKKLLTFAGPRAWTTQEVITLCERLAGQDANITTVPVSILKFTRQVTRFFQWTNDVADRLAFSEVLSSDTVFSAPMKETYELLGVDQNDIATLESRHCFCLVSSTTIWRDANDSFIKSRALGDSKNPYSSISFAGATGRICTRSATHVATMVSRSLLLRQEDEIMDIEGALSQCGHSKN